MKKIYLSASLLIVILSLVSFGFYQTFFKYDLFRWNIVSSSQKLKKVKFINGAELFISFFDPPYKDPVEESSKGVFVKDNKFQKKSLFTDDFVWIDTAFPNADSAKAAIVSHMCGGSACGNRSAYLIVPDDKTVKSYKISDQFKPCAFEAKFSDTKLVSASAKNVVLGKDLFDSNILGEIKLVNNCRFAVNNMKSIYHPLLNKYPHDFFEDKIAREPLVKLVGFQKFREIRESMAVASGGGQLIDYRYLVFTGCMAHNCCGKYGALIIDTTNDNIWWILVDNENCHSINIKHQSGSTFKIHKDEYDKYNKIFKKVNFGHDSILLLGTDGELMVELKNKQ